MNYSAPNSKMKRQIRCCNVNSTFAIVAGMGRLNIVEYIMTNWPDISVDEALKQAAKHDRQSVVKFILQRRPDIATEVRNQLLSITVQNNCLVTCRYLHSIGADMGKVCPYALFTVAEKDYFRMLKFLHLNGADIQVSNSYLLQLAAKAGNLDMVCYLHRAGLDISADDNFALMLAAEYGRLDVIRYLCQHGADIHACCNYAIRITALNGYLAVVRYLYMQGADVSEVVSAHPDVEAFIKQKIMLQSDVSRLRRLSAEVYVAHHDVMPDPESIPEDVWDILAAASC